MSSFINLQKPINIIYNIWINKNRDWEIIIQSQLQDLINSGILEKSVLYITITVDTDELFNKFKSLIEPLLSNVEFYIDKYSINLYEYYGIKKLYDLSQIEPDKIYLYIHTKGMFNYYNKPDIRNEHEKKLTQHTVNSWKPVLHIFERENKIILMCMFPSIKGFCWFNFFWVRGDYIKKYCKEPIINDNRYYYETWISSDESNKQGSIYNMYNGNYKRYTSYEALKLIELEF